MAVKSPPNKPAPSKPAARQPRPPQASRANRPRPPRNNERFAHDIWGLGLIALGLILFVSLLVGARAGLAGEALVHGLRMLVGVGAWVFPFFLTAIGVMLIQGREQHTRANFAGGTGLLFLIGIAWWHLGHTPNAAPFQNLEQGGGFAGALISAGLRKMVGDISSHILLLVFTLAALVWATDMRLLHLFDHAVEGGRRVTAPVTQGAMAGALAAKAGAQAAKQGAAALKERAEFRRQEKPDTDIVGTPLAIPSSSSRSGRTPVTEERGTREQGTREQGGRFRHPLQAEQPSP